MKNLNYYQILQVSHDASLEVIISAYHTIMSKLKKHPDLGGDEEEAALINKAYEILSDISRRATYDTSLKFKNLSNSANFTERRRVPRKDIDATISYSKDGEKGWHPARARDVSTLGMRIQAKQSIDVGAHVIIIPYKNLRSAVHGTVKWNRVFHKSVFERVYEFGVEFLDRIIDIEQRLS